MIDPRTPVLIGAGQFSLKGQAPLGPRAMLERVVGLAAADAGLAAGALSQTDLIGVVGFTIDAPGAARLPTPRLVDPPAALAQDLGARPRLAVYSHMGGNTPQAMISWAADLIAQGAHDLAVIAGAEFLGSLMKAVKSGGDLSVFGGGPESASERWGDDRDGCSPQEAAHGLNFPVNVYPLFENALRARRGRTIAEHQTALGRLFAPFSARAAQNPHAWFPTVRSPEELITPGPDNRMVGFPYPKYLNAIIQVDQAAGVILCASAKADELGVPAERRVYLHGCAEAHDRWNPLDRVDYYSSPAIRAVAAQALEMAGITPAELKYIDLYSCFPVAVEIACAEIGLAEDDPRGLTLTGGLPYFGGPGNNYAMHGIVEAMARCRADPGAFALSTANGWYLTKHAMGIYSTTPTKGPWRRADPKSLQPAINAMPAPEIIDAPEGPATIETYTVVHDRDSYRMGIVIGRDGQGRRFVANTPADEATLQNLEAREGVGRPGRVGRSADGRTNLFTPE